MKSFSKHSLIHEELKILQNNGQNWIDRIFYSLHKKIKIEYHISIPASTYLRAEVFCEDVSDISEITFTQRDLLTLLYDDFLIFVRNTDDVEIIYTQLMMKYQAYTRRVPVKKANKAIDNRFPSYFMIAEETEKNNMIDLEIHFERKKALRGEIVLSDMYEQFPDHPFTLERILEMLLCDFIEDYRKGNHKEALKKIVKSLTTE